MTAQNDGYVNTCISNCCFARMSVHYNNWHYSVFLFCYSGTKITDKFYNIQVEYVVYKMKT